MKPGRTLAVRLRPETWSRVEPPEEVCKPDSVLPPRKREQQPFVWSPGCPGDRATDPRERTGSPRLASRPDLPPTRSCSRWGLPTVRPHERTWCALTSPFHRCSAPEGTGLSPFCGTFPRSLGAVVSGHHALWSPDFPPAARGGERLLDLLRRKTHPD